MKTLAFILVSFLGFCAFAHTQNDFANVIMHLGSFQTLAECATQKVDAETIFKNGGLLNVSSSCNQGTQGPSASYELEVLGSGVAGFSDDYGNSSPKYLTLDECLKDKSRLINLHIAGGQKVLGAICRTALDSNQFKAFIYTQN